MPKVTEKEARERADRLSSLELIMQLITSPEETLPFSPRHKGQLTTPGKHREEVDGEMVNTIQLNSNAYDSANMREAGRRIMGKKKEEERGTGFADYELERFEELAGGGATPEQVGAVLSQILNERYDTQFAGTDAALSVGKAGPLRPSEDLRTPQQKEAVESKGGGLAKAVPLLGDYAGQMTPKDVEELSAILRDFPDTETGVEYFKKTKGWIRQR